MPDVEIPGSEGSPSAEASQPQTPSMPQAPQMMPIRSDLPPNRFNGLIEALSDPTQDSNSQNDEATQTSGQWTPPNRYEFNIDLN